MHRIGLFVCPAFEMLDFAGPFGTFEAANIVSGRDLYGLVALSTKTGSIVGRGGVSLKTQAVGDLTFDTIIFVGGMTEPMDHTHRIRAAKWLVETTRRVASVCTGSYLLAQTGVLNGRRATTHWRAAVDFQRRHPAVRVDADPIFIVDGPVWTSAGVTAGIDLALAMIEADHGVALAKTVSRELVVHHRRPGGQSQFSEMSLMEPESDRIRKVLDFARCHLGEDLSLERLASTANLSPRQFGRAFRRETGETPARAVERLRVEAARMRLQDGAEPVERIATAVGFNDPERMRRAFVRLHGIPPQSIRRVSRRAGTGSAANLPVT